jgi:hypothetical protein
VTFHNRDGQGIPEPAEVRKHCAELGNIYPRIVDEAGVGMLEIVTDRDSVAHAEINARLFVEEPRKARRVLGEERGDADVRERRVRQIGTDAETSPPKWGEEVKRGTQSDAPIGIRAA